MVTWAYNAKEAVDAPTTPQDWPDGWEFPDEDGPWPPDWPISVPPDTYVVDVECSGPFYPYVTNQVEAWVINNWGDNAPIFNLHLMKVTAAIGIQKVQLKKTLAGAFADEIFYQVTNYAGAKYGFLQNIVFDVSGANEGDTITVTCTVISTVPTITGDDSASIANLTLNVAAPASTKPNTNFSLVVTAKKGADTATEYARACTISTNLGTLTDTSIAAGDWANGVATITEQISGIYSGDAAITVVDADDATITGNDVIAVSIIYFSVTAPAAFTYGGNVTVTATAKRQLGATQNPATDTTVTTYANAATIKSQSPYPTTLASITSGNWVNGAVSKTFALRRSGFDMGVRIWETVPIIVTETADTSVTGSTSTIQNLLKYTSIGELVKYRDLTSGSPISPYDNNIEADMDNFWTDTIALPDAEWSGMRQIRHQALFRWKSPGYELVSQPLRALMKFDAQLADLFDSVRLTLAGTPSFDYGYTGSRKVALYVFDDADWEWNAPYYGTKIGESQIAATGIYWDIPIENFNLSGNTNFIVFYEEDNAKPQASSWAFGTASWMAQPRALFSLSASSYYLTGAKA